MPKNFFNKIKQTLLPESNSSNRISDFEKAKETLFSCKTRGQLVSAVEYINNFNKKYRITENSPEFIYFEKMIRLMKKKVRSNRFDVDDTLDEEDSMGGDFDWIERTDPKDMFDLNFNGSEYWVSFKNLPDEDRLLILDYIITFVEDEETFSYNYTRDISHYTGVVFHCGSDEYDFEPTKDNVCFMVGEFSEDEHTDYSIYIDGKELVEYIKVINLNESELIKKIIKESLKWDEENDNSFTSDEKFSSDSGWSGDESWQTNPERSYWVQGDGGSSSDDMNEEEGDFDWVGDSLQLPSSIDELYYFVNWYFIANEKTPNEQWIKDNNNRIKLWEILSIEPSKYDKNEHLVHYRRVGYWSATVNYKKVEDFLALLNGGRLVLVNPEGLLLDPQHNRSVEGNLFESSDFNWVEEIPEHPNYKGHPQGIVLLNNHEEIDEFYDIIDKYNGETDTQGRDDLHEALEDRRDELEIISAEDGEDYGEAVLSVTFFVERRRPNKLTTGYWNYDITDDDDEIDNWLSYGETFNSEYKIYHTLDDFKKVFEFI